MRERRRLALASRQLMLAQIARRTAMSALADAVEEEARSAAVSERSRALLRAYGARGAMGDAGGDAGSLRNHSAFLHSLQGITRQAEQARQDASDQASWQLQTLAAAETRAGRLEERRELARRELQAVLDRREEPLSKGMAHKLQNTDREAETPRPAQRPRNRK